MKSSSSLAKRASVSKVFHVDCLVEISLFQNEVNLIKMGDKVGASEATLLNMLNISPFSYGLVIQHGK